MALVLLVALAAVPALLLLVGHAARVPFLALAVYGAIVPFGSALAVPGLPDAFGTVSTLVGLATAGLLTVHLLFGRDRNPVLPVPVPLWLVFTALAALSLLWSVDPDATVRDTAVLISLVALFVAAALVVIRPGDLRRLEAGIVTGGAITGLIAVAQLATGTISTETGVPRFTLAGGGGEVGDPNVTAATMLLPLAIAASRATSASTRVARIVWASAGVSALTAVVLTGSRGGMLGVVAVIVIVALHERDRISLLALVIPLVLVTAVVVAASGPIADRLGETGSTGRTEIWRLGVVSCPEHCLTGSGWGTFPRVHERALATRPDATGDLYGYEAHNILLQALVELGVAGLLIFVASVWATLRLARRAAAVHRAGAVAGLVGVLLSNAFLSTFDFKYFWLALIHATVAGSSNVEPAPATAPGTAAAPVAAT